MAAKKKKIKAAGKFGSGYGVRARKNYNKIEFTQRTTQKSPFHPTGKAKRIAAGIWKCLKTGKVFAGPAYSLEENK
ncbi:50S ribosomal protein L37ae [Candidatus Pacearchaeota archaeon]|nr:50S ribosomal protein L37ae [Candidatus Pacearchaeota archaeon]|tara:strand:+ start:184 stop:411 length:228 start_codon:yes stop_codon:yes gene_type:complete